jgi:hypothetical protein
LTERASACSLCGVVRQNPSLFLEYGVLPAKPVSQEGRVPIRAPAYVPPLLVVAMTLRKGLFYLSGAGLTAILGGSFIITLTPLAIIAGISTSLLLGAVGVIIRLLENSYWPGDVNE